MNRRLLIVIIITALAAGSTVVVFAAGNSPVYSVPELSEMIDDLTSRVTILETENIIINSNITSLQTEITNEEIKEAEDFGTVATEYQDLREYVIPDYTKQPVITSFTTTNISEQYREIIISHFTIQGYHDTGNTMVSCIYEGIATSKNTISIQLGLHDYTETCYYSIGSTDTVTVVFSGDVKAQYTVQITP